MDAVRAEPQVRYVDIAAKFGIHYTRVFQIAKAAGLRRGHTAAGEENNRFQRMFYGRQVGEAVPFSHNCSEDLTTCYTRWMVYRVAHKRGWRICTFHDGDVLWVLRIG